MRRLLAVLLLLALCGVPSVAMAHVRLDQRFGDHGRVVRLGGVWADLGHAVGRPGVGALVVATRGRVVAVDGRWRIDGRYGTGGIVQSGLSQPTILRPRP